ncbi:MAG: hypothetical protein ACK5U4_20370 [Rhodospirillales bacterium]
MIPGRSRNKHGIVAEHFEPHMTSDINDAARLGKNCNIQGIVKAKSERRNRKKHGVRDYGRSQMYTTIQTL